MLHSEAQLLLEGSIKNQEDWHHSQAARYAEYPTLYTQGLFLDLLESPAGMPLILRIPASAFLNLLRCHRPFLLARPP